MDNLEKLYKKAFKDFERKPSSQFWDRLEQEIPPKPTKDRLGYFFSFSLGLTFALFLILCYSLCTTSLEDNVVAALKIPLSKIKENKGSSLSDPNINKQTTLNNNTTIEKDFQKKKNTQTPNDIKTNPIEKSKVSNPYTQLNLRESDSYIEGKSSMDNRPSETTPSLFNKASEKRAVAEQAQRPNETINPIDLLPILPVSYLLTDIREASLFKKRRKYKRKKKKFRKIAQPYLAMQYTPFSSSKFQINQRVNNFSIANNSTRVSHTSGGTITVGMLFPSNWLTEISASYHHFVLENVVSQLITASFNSADEQENGYLQTYTFNNGSSVDDVKGTATIYSDFGVQESGDQFALKVNNQQHLKFISIYQQVGYQFSINPRWQVLPKVGIGATWAKKSKIQESITTLPDERLELINASIGATSQTTTNILEGVVSTELAYHYSRNLYFLLTPQLRYGIQPFYENSERSFKNKFMQIQFGLRIRL